jgi:glutathione S-transferase
MTQRCTLHHFPLDPASRQARLALGEKRVVFEEVIVRYWEPDSGIDRLNPSGQPPVLVVEETGKQKLVLCEIAAVIGWLQDNFAAPALMSDDPVERAEVRRLRQWFDRKFDYEVNALLLHEKMEKRLLGLGPPDMAAMRAGREALRRHFTLMEDILKTRDWLAGRRLSLADFAAAAHISVLDYFDEAPWAAFPAVKTWYMKLKSRPCFRPLLADRQPGMAPSAHYDDLDF